MPVNNNRSLILYDVTSSTIITRAYDWTAIKYEPEDGWLIDETAPADPQVRWRAGRYNSDKLICDLILQPQQYFDLLSYLRSSTNLVAEYMHGTEIKRFAVLIDRLPDASDGLRRVASADLRLELLIDNGRQATVNELILDGYSPTTEYTQEA